MLQKQRHTCIDLRRWEEEITEPVKDSPQQMSLINESEYRKLKKELDRKNKALAEAAALLVLSKSRSDSVGKEEEK